MPTALQADTMGPVDVAVILFEGNQFNGDVAPAIAELAESGTVRVIDLAFVRKETDESISVRRGERGRCRRHVQGYQRVAVRPAQRRGFERHRPRARSRLLCAGRRMGEQLGCAHGRRGPGLSRPSDRLREDPRRQSGAGHRRTKRGIGEIMPRRMGRPGLMGTMARTAVIAGTATVVSGAVKKKARRARPNNSRPPRPNSRRRRTSSRRSPTRPQPRLSPKSKLSRQPQPRPRRRRPRPGWPRSRNWGK